MENEDQECPIDGKIEEIKYGIIAQIFSAGANWQTENFKAIDKNGKISKEKRDELQSELENIMRIYADVIELVWGDTEFDDEESDDCVCDDCKKLVENDDDTLTDEDKKKLKSDFGLN
jgi:hypothetical protein